MPNKPILYVLLALQLMLSIGYMNEFDDVLMAFVATVLFFALQLYFLFGIVRPMGITIFVSVIAFLHLFNLIAFLDEGTEIISNKWPAEVYYATRTWVIWMSTIVLGLDAIKLGILHRGSLKKIMHLQGRGIVGSERVR